VSREGARYGLVDLDFESEPTEFPHEPVGGSNAIGAIEVIGTEIGVGNAALEDEIGGGQHRGSDGEDGLLRTAAAFQTQKLRPQIRALRARRRPGGLGLNMSSRAADIGIAEWRISEAALPAASHPGSR
jgi:hypothetical protein